MIRAPVRSRGVALVTALLVVALATTAAVAMVSRQHLDIRRTANLLESEQAYLYTIGIEAWAGKLLRLDGDETETDHLGEAWAQALPPIPVEGGQITGQATDPQARFNLNNLVDAAGKADPVAQARFQRLLTLLNLSPDLAMAVTDWIDPDIELTFPGGAEDGEYLGLEPPYRPGNTAMVSVSELRLVQGVTPEIFDTLAPYVTALPGQAALNVNTVAEETPELYMMLDEKIGQGEAEALFAARGEAGYETVDDFLQVVPALPANIEKRLAVGTDYFMVTSSVQIGRSILTMNSLLHRPGKGPVRTVRRSQAGY